MMKQLTRKQKQAQTRQCLMRSAAKMFTQRGLAQTSIDDVAQDAGFTKGAFYANFANKQELFLAMLDERFARKIEQIEEVIAGKGSEADKALRAGDQFTEQFNADPEWQRLFLEFSAYAARDEDFREELVTRYRWMRARIAAALERQAQLMPLDMPIPAERIAMMTCAMANGIAVERLLEGDAIPEDIFGTMLMVFFRGLRVLAEEQHARP